MYELSTHAGARKNNRNAKPVSDRTYFVRFRQDCSPSERSLSDMRHV